MAGGPSQEGFHGHAPEDGAELFDVDVGSDRSGVAAAFEDTGQDESEVDAVVGELTERLKSRDGLSEDEGGQLF